MGIILIVVGIVLIVAGLACTYMIIADAFDNELWMGLMCLIFFPYMIWYAFAEFDHEKKWLMILCWLFATSIGSILLAQGRMMTM